MTPKPAWRVAILQRPWKPDGRYGWLPAARAARTLVEGLIWLFSLASGRIPPVDYRIMLCWFWADWIMGCPHLAAQYGSSLNAVHRSNPQRDCGSAYSGFGRGCYSDMEQSASRRATSSISGGGDVPG